MENTEEAVESKNSSDQQRQGQQIQDPGQGQHENLESVLKRIGGGGARYNLFVLAAMSFCLVYPGMLMLSANYTSAQVPFSCSEYSSHDTYFNETLFTECMAIPETTSQKNPQCRLSYNCSSLPSSSGHHRFSGNATAIVRVHCRQLNFSGGYFQETIISKFELVCDRAWMSSLATTFFFTGYLVGSYLYGALADRFGRLAMIWISMVHMSGSVIGASQATNLWLYWSLQLLAGIGIGGFLSCTYSFAMEHTEPKLRTLWGFILPNGVTSGIFLGILIAYFERHYQRILLYYGLSVLALVPVLALLSESPRWLVAVRRFDQADTVLKRIARINGRPLENGFSSEVAVGSFSVSKRKANVVDLLRRPGIRRVTLIVWTIFFNAALAYFGISLGIGDLGGSVLVNQMISAAVEIPARMVGMAASYRIGRKLSIMISFGSAGVCLFVTVFLVGNGDLAGLRIAAAMMGKFWITMALDLAWLYSAEVFPTVARSLGVGSGSTFHSAGAIVSTLLPGLGFAWSPLPFLIMAMGPMCVVLVTFWLAPETRGRRLPETLNDVEQLAPGDSCIRLDNEQDDKRNDTEL